MEEGADEVISTSYRVRGTLALGEVVKVRASHCTSERHEVWCGDAVDWREELRRILVKMSCE